MVFFDNFPFFRFIFVLFLQFFSSNQKFFSFFFCLVFNILTCFGKIFTKKDLHIQKHLLFLQVISEVKKQQTQKIDNLN